MPVEQKHEMSLQRFEYNIRNECDRMDEKKQNPPRRVGIARRLLLLEVRGDGQLIQVKLSDHLDHVEPLFIVIKRELASIVRDKVMILTKFRH